MSYAELIKCDKDKVKSLHIRCAHLLNDILSNIEDNRIKHGYCAAGTHQQMAYNLYQLCMGFLYYAEVDVNMAKCQYITREYKLPFESLEELELKLAIRGY